MLQQTQIATVIPYYHRFLKAFPSIPKLARSRLELVLQLWSGLGYYRRARHMHAAARKMVMEFGGKFPATLPEARSLPGVGSYTAAAVLSIAYNVPLAVLDGNVARVVARIDARRGSVAEPKFRKALEVRLQGLLSQRRPGDFNQALMELGQTVCLPRSPRCPSCPVRRWCRADQLGSPEAFPSPRPRRAIERHHLAAAVIFRPNCVADGDPNSGGISRAVMLVRGLDDGLMSDLWNFPSAFGRSPAHARVQLQTKIEALGMPSSLTRDSGSGNVDSGATSPTVSGKISVGAQLARLRHGVTYRDIEVRAYHVEIAAPPSNGIRWLKLSSFGDAAVSELARKIARSILAAR
jgi:A/G-specific adenine glycosylase